MLGDGAAAATSDGVRSSWELGGGLHDEALAAAFSAKLFHRPEGQQIWGASASFSSSKNSRKSTSRLRCLCPRGCA